MVKYYKILFFYSLLGFTSCRSNIDTLEDLDEKLDASGSIIDSLILETQRGFDEHEKLRDSIPLVTEYDSLQQDTIVWKEITGAQKNEN